MTRSGKSSKPLFVLTASLLCMAAFVTVAQTPSTAPQDVVLRAMGDELQRSMTELKLNNLDTPYFIQYIVLDEDEYAARATFGAITQSNPLRQRLVYTQVRVGSYDFDNSEFAAGPGGGAGAGGGLLRATVEDDYENLRHTLWLGTDAAYKSSVEVIAQKRSALQNRTQEEKIPDFSKEQPTQAVGTRRKLEVDRARIDDQLRRWSLIFREFPAIQSSNVTIRARLNHRYIVNSEGTRTMQPELLVILQASASAQAPDGMNLGYSIPVYVREFADLPSFDSYAATIRQLAKDLSALREAPALASDYSGPALLVGNAATEMFARVLAPNLTGQRGPLARNGQVASPPLEDRLNRPILPSYMSVVDDPTVRALGDRKLIGYYSIDDQGVPVQRLSLVENGLLTNLLMSRRPGKGRLQSNGHGRNGYPGRETPQAGNLIITATGGKDYEDLKKELLKAAKEERLDYAIIIKGVNVTGNGAVGTPVLTYRVRVSDGREELVRVGGTSGLTVQGLRHMVAIGNDSTASNRLVGTAGAETPTTIVAPSVLVEEISVDKPAGNQQKPALLSHPFFGN